MGNENLLPKNIRQIGDIQGRQKICLEDYVMTYIRKAEGRESGNFLGIFLGERKCTEDAEYVFVRGMIEVPDPLQMKQKTEGNGSEQGANGDDTGDKEDRGTEAAGDGGREKSGLWQAFQKRYGAEEGLLKNEREQQPESDGTGGNDRGMPQETRKEDTSGETLRDDQEPQDLWEYLKMEQEMYFPGCEIQGCCVIGTYPAGRIEELSAHFPEAGRLLYHLQDQEERLYWMEGDQYENVRGYFVFYEQNQRMQEYLTKVFGEAGIEKEGLPDKAIRSFREKVKSKAEEKSRSFLKLASSFFVVGVLIAGVIVVNRVDSTRQMQETAEITGLSSDTGEISTADVSGTAETELAGSHAFWDEDAEAVTADELQTESNTSGTADESQAASDTTGMADEVLSVSGTTNAMDETQAASDASDVSQTVSGTASITDESQQTASDTAGQAGEVQTDSETANTASGTQTASDSADTADEAQIISDTDDDAEEIVEASGRQLQAAYVIQEGDTLAAICFRYYGSLDRLEELCEENAIEDANRIIPGQKIVLP